MHGRASKKKRYHIPALHNRSVGIRNKTLKFQRAGVYVMMHGHTDRLPRVDVDGESRDLNVSRVYRRVGVVDFQMRLLRIRWADVHVSISWGGALAKKRRANYNMTQFAFASELWLRVFTRNHRSGSLFPFFLTVRHNREPNRVDNLYGIITVNPKRQTTNSLRGVG